jgi:sugar transferase (PEP-CTERM system associated)
MVQIFRQYVSVKSLALLAMETMLIVLSLIAAVKLRLWADAAEAAYYLFLPEFGVQCVLVVLVFQVCFYYNGLYDLCDLRGWSDHMFRLSRAIGAACIVLGLVYSFIPSLLLGQGIFLLSIVITSASVMFVRVGLDATWDISYRRERVVIIGGGPVAGLVVQEFRRRNDLNADIVAVLDGDGSAVTEDAGGMSVRSQFENLLPLVEAEQVTRIILASENRLGLDEKVTDLPTRDLVRLRVRGVRIEDAQTVLAALTGRIPLSVIRPSWFLLSDGFRRSPAVLACKRMVDVLLSLAGIIVSAPLMLMVAIAIRLDSRGPVLYKQVRTGWRGQLFQVLKFRSMHVDAEKNTGAQWAQINDPRVTRVGRFIRKYRLDELPQFFNVLAGDMSFVGPRPERPEFVETLRKMVPYYEERLSVRPGLTGWAQIQCSYGASLDDAARKLEYDLFYLENMSVLFDLTIAFKTVRTVLFGVGAR